MAGIATVTTAASLPGNGGAKLAIAIDTGKLHVWNGASWISPEAAAPTWDDVSGKPATFTPATHNHDAAYSALGHTHAGVYEPADAALQTHIAAAHAPSNAQKNSDITKAEIEAKLTGQIASHTHAGDSEAFPVGAVFIAVVATDPATLLGYGTWSAIAAGRMLVGLDSGDTDFDAAEETGGAKTHTLTTPEIPAHTHVQDAHSHVITQLRDATTGGVTTNIALTADTSSTLGTKITGTTVATNQNAGGGGAHNNMPPYFVCYMWKRTA